jgi:hypothetical protein
MVSHFSKILFCSILLISSILKSQHADSVELRRIFDYYLTESNCYKNLEYLATKIGGSSSCCLGKKSDV